MKMKIKEAVFENHHCLGTLRVGQSDEAKASSSRTLSLSLEGREGIGKSCSCGGEADVVGPLGGLFPRFDKSFYLRPNLLHMEKLV